MRRALILLVAGALMSGVAAFAMSGQYASAEPVVQAGE